MPVARKVHSYSSDTWIGCCWFGCEKQGFELYKTVFHEHSRSLTCGNPMAEHVNFIFCTERHKQYFINSRQNFGKLPPGYKLSI